jgi:hypothetical protein
MGTVPRTFTRVSCRGPPAPGSGETHITAVVRDEAELFGLLERLRDLGAALISVSIDP